MTALTCPYLVNTPYAATSAALTDGSAGAGINKQEILDQFSQMAPQIIQNKGQVENRNVKFYISSYGKSIFFTDDAVVMDLFQVKQDEGSKSGSSKKGVVVRQSFIGGRAAVIAGKKQNPTRINYLKGNNKNSWKKGINTFQQLLYSNLYPGINLRYASTKGSLKYQFELAAGANPEDIRIGMDGIDGLSLDKTGDKTGNLIIKTAMGRMVDKKPYTYQEIDGKKVQVASAFNIINNREFGFTIGKYNRQLPLIIDPGIAWSTFLGGELAERGMGIAIDLFGHVTVTGYTYSTTFPTVNGLYTDQPNKDLFISKLTADGSSFIYSTYLGGSQDEEAHDITFDRAGHTFLAGYTTSPDFPATFTIGAGGAMDAFVLKLTPDGTAIDYSTVMGEAQDDQAHTMQVDGDGDAYITGYTYSANFPAGGNHTQYGPRGVRDIFVIKLNRDGNNVRFSASIGGTGDDNSHDLKINYKKFVYLTGTTSSADFPTTTGPALAGGSDLFILKMNKDGKSLDYSRLLGGAGNDTGHGIIVSEDGTTKLLGYSTDTSFLSGAVKLGPGGGADVFVAGLDKNATTILNSTIIGGTGDDICHDIVRDGVDNLYIVGHTLSSDFPVTVDAVDKSYNGLPNADIFAVKLAADMSSLLYATYIGGDGHEEAHDLLLDSSGNAFITGWTTSAVNFPITAGAVDPTFAGTEEAFLLKLRITEPVQLYYATYLGGSKADEANAIAVDRYGDVYIAGYTSSTDFPTSFGAYDSQLGNGDSNQDIFVTKLESNNSQIIYSTYIGGSQNEFISHFSKAMAIDESENIYLAGRTKSSDFPTTPGAEDSILGTNGSGQDAFITVLSAAGDTLLYSTFLGGDLLDEVSAMTLDKLGDIYVTGIANSKETTFPNTIGPVHSGGKDAFVAKITPDDTTPGNDLIYFRFLGGSKDDQGHAIAVDYNMNAYITGNTMSVTGEAIAFPTTTGAYKTITTGNKTEAFISRLAADGSLLYSTFLGGDTDINEGYAIGLDPAGNIYVAGLTAATDFPTTAGAFQTTFNGGPHDAFVSKLTPAGNGTADLLYSTFMGGSKHDHIHDIFTTSIGEVYIAGTTASTDFPVSVFGFQSIPGGKDDAFIAELSAAGDKLIFSTFLGGSENEEGTSIVVDNAGSVYVAGMTASKNDFPVTSGAVQQIYGGGSMDAFVAKLGIAATISQSPDTAYNNLNYLDLQDGTTLTTFTYKVLYNDPENIPIAPQGYMKAYIDGAEVNMVQDSGCGVNCDGDLSNGEQFLYSTLMPAGKHNYYFEASNGLLSTVRLPKTGVFTGPGGPEMTPLPEMKIKFQGVVAPGSITASKNDLGTAPDNYQIGTNASYDIISTVGNAGENAVITINYTDAQIFSSVNAEQNLKLLHKDAGKWVDITLSLDTVNNIITGTTASFSPFMLASLNMGITAVHLLYFRPEPDKNDKSRVTLVWETGSEIDNEGFYIYRSKSRTGGYQQINHQMVQAEGSIFRGRRYSFVDNNIKPGVKYYYRLDDIDSSGRQTMSAYAVIPEQNKQIDTTASLSNGTVSSGSAAGNMVHEQGKAHIPVAILRDNMTNIKTTSLLSKENHQVVEKLHLSNTPAGILIKWNSSNNKVDGFNIFRSKTPDGNFVLVNDKLIEPPDNPENNNTRTSYSYRDKPQNGRYFYKVAAVFNSFDNDAKYDTVYTAAATWSAITTRSSKLP